MRLDGASFKEIGIELGVTRQRAEQIIAEELGINRFKFKSAYPNIIMRMQEMEITFDDLREELGLKHVQNIYGYLGGRDIRLSTARKISDLLGLTIDEAFKREEE